MPVSVARREHAKGLVDRSIRKAIRSTGSGTRAALARLIWTVQGRSELLRPSRIAGRAYPGRLDRFVGGLVALAWRFKVWLRPLEEWEPSGSNPLPIFSSLAHHLLAEYPVPPVLLSAWFRGTSWRAKRMQDWFVHAGRGGSLREVGFPIAFTRRMAHEFAGAPAQFPIEFALRWAQARGMGASDDLARAVASTRLGSNFGEDDFWRSAVQLFVDHPRIEPDDLALVVDYLHDRKFVPVTAIVGDDVEVALDPPEPDLTVRDRPLASLIRRAAAWKAGRDAQPGRQVIRWKRLGIGGYRREGESGRAWTIRELLDADELAAEGKAMSHCVATYTKWCLKGRSSIWSLGLEGPEGRARLVTIEVDPESKKVIQAKMKDNEPTDGPSLNLIASWAQQQGLNLDLS